MLQYADEVIYAARGAKEGGDSPSKILGHVAKSIAEYTFTMSTLDMLSKAPRIGYNIPWTKNTTGFLGGQKKKAEFADWGRRHGIWGARGARMGRASGAISRATLRSGARLTGMNAFKMGVGRVAGFAFRAVDPLLIAPLLIEGGVLGYRALSNASTNVFNQELGGYFPETQGSYTSRQRALEAISNSHLQAKSAIGNEAMLLHRGTV